MSESARGGAAPAQPESEPAPKEPPAGQATDTSRRLPRPALLAAVVAVVAVAVFAASVGGPWIYDDHNLIELNPYIRSFHYWRHWLTTDLWNVSMTSAPNVRPHYYRPLVTLSYALDWALGQGSPFLFHVTNLVLEAAAGGLAFYTLRRWLGASLPALVAALLFVVHPTKAQSVAWIAGRIDVMCAVGLFVASTGVAWRLSGRRGGIALEIAGTLLAYLTKETAVVLPAFVVVEAWVALGRPPLDLGFSLEALRKAAPQLGVAVVYLGLHHLLMPMWQNVPATSGTGDRVALFLATLGHAAELVVFPWRLMMQHALVRVDPSTGQAIYSPVFIALGAVALLSVAAGAWFARRRAPAVTLGLLFFAVTFLPTANLVPTRLVELMPQRFLYLPLLGIALAVGELVRRAHWKELALSCSLVVIVAFSARSILRARDFDSEQRLWQHEVAVNPMSTLARLQLAYVDLHEHRYDAAMHKFAEAYTLAHRWFRTTGREVALVIEAVDLISYQTPDARRGRLERIDRFVTAALRERHGKATLTLENPALHAVLDLDSPLVHTRLSEIRPTLLISHADIQSRIGEPAEAARAGLAAHRACRSCATLGARAALVLARSGRYADAYRLLGELEQLGGGAVARTTEARIKKAESWRRRSAAPGPRGILAHAEELSVLGAYGRAFEVLSPHEDAIRRAPHVALGYAELAWRAGHHDVAQRVLAGHVPRAELQRLTRQWSEHTGRLPEGRRAVAH